VTDFIAEEHVSDASLRMLSRLVGRQVTFHASSVEIEPDFFQVEDVSIALGAEEFICMSWDWYDTEICAVDVFKLIVEEKKTPRGIDYADSTFRGGAKINTALPNRVEKIHIIEGFDEDEIIEGQNKGHSDHVRFDCGVIFEMATPPSLAFGCEGSIAGAMPVTYIPGWRMREYLREHNVRVTLDRENSIGGPVKQFLHDLGKGKRWPSTIRAIPDVVRTTILKRFDQPDELREFSKGKFEIVHLGGMTIGRATYQPGWKWSEDVGKAMNEAFCTVEHVGMVVSGCATAAMKDGEVHEMRAGDIFYVPSHPHDSWVIGDEPYVSLHFLGADRYTNTET